jgi:trimeric autotransporter adhesin
MKNISILITILALSGLNGAMGQWTTSGDNIYNTNSGNVGVGNNTPSTLLYVAKNMTEPTITVRNLGGTGGATYTMMDQVSGANWKFKATNSGGFKIRDHANLLDVIVIEPNSAANAIYINGAGNIGLGTNNPSQQLELTQSFELPATTSSNTGVIYKGSERFIHNYQPFYGYGENTFVGVNSGNFTMSALLFSSQSSWNTAVGVNTLNSTSTGSSNTAIGNNALFSNTEGHGNIAIGHYALYLNTTGSYNTTVGKSAFYNNLTGNHNTVLGASAGFGSENCSFSNSTIIGSMAGSELSTGSDNILIGYKAGDNLTTGSKNIIIGFDIDAKAINGMEEMILGHPDLLYGDITNKRIGIGTPTPQEQLHLKNTASVTLLLQADSDNDNVDENENPRFELKQDGEVVTGGLGFIGDDGAIYSNSLANSLYLVNEYTTPLQFGTADSVVMTILGNAKVGIGTTDPIQRLDVNGNARFRSVGSSAYTSALNLTANGTLTTNTSDIRLKTNIETLNDGLDRVMKLRGVEFNWKSEPEGKKMIGFIAQETEQVVPELVFTNPTDGYMGINYAEMTAVLVEAVKQQQKMIEELQKKVEELEGK